MRRKSTPTMNGSAFIVALGLSASLASVASGDEPAAAAPVHKSASVPNLAFADILEPTEKSVIIATNHRFTEGPVWVPRGTHGNERGYLLYSDIPQNCIYRLDFNWETAGKEDAPKPTVWLEPSGRANGLMIDPDTGVYMACHDGSVQWTEFDDAKATATLANSYDGKGLNSPNDLVRMADGSIVFTDPPYGLRPPLGGAGRKRELDFCGVYRLPKSGPLELLTDKIERPNGVALSPDERTLYVADTGTGRVYAMGRAAAPEARNEGEAAFSNLRDFCKVEAGDKVSFADGLKVDVQGNLYVAGPKGAWVFDPAGNHLGVIEAPEGKHPTNLCFGGDDAMTLFMTTRDSVSAVRVRQPGNGVKPRVMPADSKR